MGILDLFSKRQKAARTAGQPDVYQYENIPREFRVQVIHIWASAVHGGAYIVRSPRLIDGPAWEVMSQALARELGIMRLSDESNPFHQCQDFLINASTEQVLDIIELTFSVIDQESQGDFEARRVEHAQAACGRCHPRAECPFPPAQDRLSV